MHNGIVLTAVSQKIPEISRREHFAQILYNKTTVKKLTMTTMTVTMMTIDEKDDLEKGNLEMKTSLREILTTLGNDDLNE